MANYKNHKLNVDGGFVIILTWRFHSEIEFQSIAYLLNGSEHICWILDLEDEVHSIWDLWISGLQERKGRAMVFSKSDGWATNFGWV